MREVTAIRTRARGKGLSRRVANAAIDRRRLNNAERLKERLYAERTDGEGRIVTASISFRVRASMRIV